MLDVLVQLDRTFQIQKLFLFIPCKQKAVLDLDVVVFLEQNCTEVLDVVYEPDAFALHDISMKERN